MANVSQQKQVLDHSHERHRQQALVPLRIMVGMQGREQMGYVVPAHPHGIVVRDRLLK